MQPLVSIIMPSFNQATYLNDALDSVLQQSWRHVELIVMDGGSTDGSVALLQARQAQDPRLRWWSQPDKGPAHALNKALQKVRGTLVGWLNSDDRYTAGAIARAITSMQAHPEWMMCYGQGEHINAQGQYIEHYPTLPTQEAGTHQVPEKATFQNGCFICQPTVFFKAVMPRLLGPLDQQLGAAFDFDYWLRAFNAFPGRIGFIPTVQAQSRLHDDCITQRQRRRVAIEGMATLARHQGSAPGHWVLTYINEQTQQGVTSHALKQDIEQLMQEIRSYMQPHEWHTLLTELENRQYPLNA